jgi:prepilin-type N-terminal cleavage/methylation domain-containing protein
MAGKFILTFHQRKNDRGFSLIEILLAIAILALVALGIMALLPGGYKQITNAGRSATLNHLGQMKLDHLRTLPLSHTDLTDGNHPSVGPEWPLGTDDKFTITWAVETYTPLTNSKSIIVEVGYDIYETDGSDKSSTRAIEQKRILFPTIISQ